MAECRVLRFPISEKKGEYFLLEHISRGSQPLDMKLVGTEGERSFAVKIRHKRINDLKAASGHCSDAEWEQILVTTLVDQGVLDGIVATVDFQEKSATLNFRKNIQGITQRLGSINLVEATDEEEISLFDWCLSVVESRAKVVEDLAAATAKADALEQSVKELKSQLDELIKAKEDDETQLLEKFMNLLNEKKLKIKQQQRLLASAEVDPEKLANIGASQNTQRKAQSSRRSKRKAIVNSSSDSDDGFEKMDVDQGDDVKNESNLDDEEAEERERTEERPTTDDDETQSEAGESDEEPVLVSPTLKSKGKGKQAGQKAISTRGKAAAAKSASTSASTSAPTSKKQDAPPPMRTLPFAARKKAPAPAPKPAEDDEGDGTESDDEL